MCPGRWCFRSSTCCRVIPRSSTFALEGLLLFALLWRYSARPRPNGAVSAVFLIGYGAFRFIAEFGREPDSFLGLIAFGLSMGQWLSLPMIAAGLWLWQRAHRS